MRALEPLSRPFSAPLLGVPRSHVLPQVADASAGDEAADVALGNLEREHLHMTSVLRGGGGVT